MFRRVGDEWLLFDPESERIHVLNLTSALIWSFCTGEFTVDDIVEEVRAAFDEPVDPDAVTTALTDFRQAGLLAAEDDVGGGDVGGGGTTEAPGS